MNQNYIVYSKRNQRPKNEDSFLVCQLLPVLGREPVTILALADGMGGYAHGEDISREALRKIGAALFEELCVSPALNNSGTTETNFKGNYEMNYTKRRILIRSQKEFFKHP